MICYFSGTGNSKYVAEEISKNLNDDLIDINKRIKNNNTNATDVNGKLIVVTPTYAWRIPRIVNKWILDTKFNNVKEVYYVMTCGDEIGNADKYNKRLSKQKGFLHKGTFEIIMPENYIALFNTPNNDEAKQIVSMSKIKIQNVIDNINDEVDVTYDPTFKDKFKSSLVNDIFYPVFVNSKKFNVTNLCVGCNKCVSLCPLNNISLKDNKPVWKNNCTHCMACISYCPTKAIEYGKDSSKKERYYLKDSYK